MATLPYLWNIEWYNANSQRKYPLRDDATLADDTGSFQLPNDLIVEFSWPAHALSTIDPTGFYVSGVSIFGTGVVLSFSYLGTLIGTTSVDFSGFTPNTAKTVQGVNSFADSIGTVVIGSLSGVQNFVGSYNFSTPAQSGFLPSVLKMAPRGVTAIYLKNGTDVSAALQGDLTLEAGRNISIEYLKRSGTPDDPNVISISAISGVGLNADCGCNEATALPCIKTIDGVSPNSDGEFFLDQSECIKLTAIANGLSIKDACSTPCCGCQELDVVKSALQTVISQVNAMNSYADALAAQIRNMEVNALL